MAKLLLPLLLISCFSPLTEKKQDFNKKEAIDWLEIYNNEIKIAIENEDTDAFHFFLQEYVRERKRLKK